MFNLNYRDCKKLSLKCWKCPFWGVLHPKKLFLQNVLLTVQNQLFKLEPPNYSVPLASKLTISIKFTPDLNCWSKKGTRINFETWTILTKIPIFCKPKVERFYLSKQMFPWNWKVFELLKVLKLLKYWKWARRKCWDSLHSLFFTVITICPLLIFPTFQVICGENTGCVTKYVKSSHFNFSTMGWIHFCNRNY